MPYKLKNPGILSDLHPGDMITADLFVSQNADADVYLDHIVVIAQGKPDYKPTVMYHVPAPGDAVPDFPLRNQDGRTHRAQSVSRQRSADHVHLHALPAAQFLPAGHAQLRGHQSRAERRSGCVSRKRICSASASIRNMIRRLACGLMAPLTSAAMRRMPLPIGTSPFPTKRRWTRWRSILM